jgi:hypothetical protein
LPLFIKYECDDKEKAHPLKRKNGLLQIYPIVGATPLPIITGPEALRPTLSRGLPFSQHLYFYVLDYIGTEQKMFRGLYKKNALFYVDISHCGYFGWVV